jgi:hypothetical protein
MSSRFNLYRSISWNNRVGSFFEREDVHGNKVFHIKKQSTYDVIRYVEYHNIVYFSVNDVLLSFVVHSNLNYQSIWNDLPSECKVELEKYMHLHVFKNDDNVESVTLRFNDIIKLIMLIPVTFDVVSKNLDLFLAYYQTYFGYISNMKKTSACERYDCCFNYVFFLSFVVGFLCAFLVFWAVRLFKFQE